MPIIAMKLHFKPCFPEEFANSFVEVCADLQISDALAIGHSYGTIMMRWFDLFCPGLVQRRIFIDPICFKLWSHHVAQKFFYDSPNDAISYGVKYIATMEPGIALYMRDYFVWFQNTYFTEFLPSNTTIFFAENDHIIDYKVVVPYLEKFPCISRKIEIVKKSFHGKMLLMGDLQPIFNAIAADSYLNKS
jgi:pimeloyl-ACP methyl ester carboxylesterase